MTEQPPISTLSSALRTFQNHGAEKEFLWRGGGGVKARKARLILELNQWNLDQKEELGYSKPMAFIWRK